MQEMEKIETLRGRYPLSYKEAGHLLKKFNGDVLQALDWLEREKKTRGQRMKGHIEDLVEEYARKY